MNEYKKLGKNVLLITIGNFSSKILSFLFIPLYTAILSTGEYGISDLITTTVNLILPFFTVLISEATMRFALEKNSDKNQIFSIGFWICLVGFLLMCLSSPLLLLNGVLKDYYGIFVVFYAVTMLHTFVSQFAKGIEEVAAYTISGVIGTVTYILFNIVFLLGFKTGLNGYLWAHIISLVCSTAYLFIKVKAWEYCLSFKKLDKAYMVEMLKYSIPLIPNSISWWVSNSSDKYIVTAMCGVAINGIYSIAYKIPTMFCVFSTIFMNAWHISAVNTFDTDEASEFYTKIYKLYNVFNIILVSALICMTQVLAKILFLKEFYSAWVFVPVLLIGYLFNSMGSFLGTIYTSAKKTKMVFLTTMSGAIINIVLNFILVAKIGAMGAAIATFISYLVIWLVRLIDTHKILELNINIFKDIINYALLIIQCIVMCAEVEFSHLIAAGIFVIIICLNGKMIKDIIFTLATKVLRRK